MKTGGKESPTDPSYIGFLALDAILKRVGFKDCVLFKEHNFDCDFDPELFESGIYFNLFSEYGIGKKLETILKDLIFKHEINDDNIFSKEILNLVPNISLENENIYGYKYAIESLNKEDDISKERLERLFSLIDNNNNEIHNCKCNFCEEFKKYHIKRDKNINEIILDIIKQILTN